MQDIRSRIDNSSITATQYGVIAMCLIINMLDGMDVMVMSYAAPALLSEWQISPQNMGVIFSSALLGMAIGAASLTPCADLVGRRTITIASALIMGTSVLLTAFAETISQLLLFRFISGLGIGSMLANTVILASEYAPERQKNFVVSIVLSGYPIGASLSGIVAAYIIPSAGWRMMFFAAGSLTLAVLLLLLWRLPESWDWLVQRRPKNALARLNDILARMGHPPVSALPSHERAWTHSTRQRPRVFRDRKAATVKLWIAYFMAFASLYFMLTWIPNLVTATGLSVQLAIYAGTVFTMAGIAGNLSQGYLSQVIGLRKTTLIYYGCTAILMFAFGRISGNWAILTAFALIGFGIQGGITGLYGIAARAYPTEIRGAGLGWATGMGRLGSIVSPALGGFLINRGVTPSEAFAAFALPLFVTCMMMWLLPIRETDSDDEKETVAARANR